MPSVNDTICHHKSESTLTQVLAYCLTAPSHYLNQCWLTINKVLWHLFQATSNVFLYPRFISYTHDINPQVVFEIYTFKITATSPREQWDKVHILPVFQALINRRYSEIDKKEKVVAQEIKTFAVKLITEINRRGKKLLTDLNSVCGAKMRQLGIKHNEILVLAMRLSHALKFAEYALEHGSGSAVLHSKKVLVNQLKTVLRTRCEVPNPYHVVDIRLKYELNGITNALAQQGTLLVDGVPYNGPTVSGAAGHPSMRTQAPQSPGTSRMAPNFSNLTPDQRAALMHRLAKMAQQQGKTLPNMSPVSAQGSPHGFRQAPQSSMVSSSNHKAAGYFGHGGRSSSVPHPNMINLAQLQQKRRMQHAMQAAAHTSAAAPGAEQTPIVIQPTASPTGQHYNQSGELCGLLSGLNVLNCDLTVSDRISTH